MAVVKNRVGELLAKRERECGRRISNEEAAREVGISRSSFEAWRYNKVTRFDSDQIIKLCRYFGVGPGELFLLPEMEEGPELRQEFQAA